MMNLQALAASGLRSIRYALEIDEIGQVVALDRDKGVFSLFKLVPSYVVFCYFADKNYVEWGYEFLLRMHLCRIC